MAVAKVPPIDRISLIGGDLSLDFVNTTGARRSGAPRERLHAWRDVVVWCRRVGLPPPAVNAERASAPLRRLLFLREAIYRIFRSTLDGTAPAGGDVARLNTALARSARVRRLDSPARGRWAWTPEVGEDAVAGPVARAAADLLTSPRGRSLRKCDECDWLFLDVSRGRRRRWCKKTCRDRVKSRAYYRRRKTSSP